MLQIHEGAVTTSTSFPKWEILVAPQQSPLIVQHVNEVPCNDQFQSDAIDSCVHPAHHNVQGDLSVGPWAPSGILIDSICLVLDTDQLAQEDAQALLSMGFNMNETIRSGPDTGTRVSRTFWKSPVRILAGREIRVEASLIDLLGIDPVSSEGMSAADILGGIDRLTALLPATTNIAATKGTYWRANRVDLCRNAACDVKTMIEYLARCRPTWCRTSPQHYPNETVMWTSKRKGFQLCCYDKGAHFRKKGRRDYSAGNYLRFEARWSNNPGMAGLVAATMDWAGVTPDSQASIATTKGPVIASPVILDSVLRGLAADFTLPPTTNSLEAESIWKQIAAVALVEHPDMFQPMLADRSWKLKNEAKRLTDAFLASRQTRSLTDVLWPTE